MSQDIWNPPAAAQISRAKIYIRKSRGGVILPYATTYSYPWTAVCACCGNAGTRDDWEAALRWAERHVHQCTCDHDPR